MEIYLKLIWAYLKIGLFGFGGGYAMLSLIEREVVQSGWITSNEFTDIVAISQMTPGPIGINSATYIGYVVGGGIIGSIIATFVVVVPSYLLVLYATHYVQQHRDSNIINGILFGLRPVVVGLIASAALLLMNKDNFVDYSWSIIICAISFLIVYFVKIHPIYVIIMAGIAGWIIY